MRGKLLTNPRLSSGLPSVRNLDDLDEPRTIPANLHACPPLVWMVFPRIPQFLTPGSTLPPPQNPRAMQPC